MKFSRKYMYAAAAPLTIGGLLATTAALPTSAAARPAPRHIASGSMALSGPLQYEQFRALQGFGRYHGQVTYTNWQYAEAGSGVYAPLAGAHALTFNFGGAYNHTLNDGLKLTALSPDRLAFSGTGVYSDGTTTWKIKGEVRDSNVSATITYNQGIFNADCLVIPKGGKNVALAQKAIALMVSPDLQANIPALIDYGPINAKAFDTGKITPEAAAKINSSPVNAARQTYMNFDFWRESLAKLTERMDAFLQQ